MLNMNIVYNVTGRYMDGQRVVGYHLVGEDGSQACEGRERVIYLIGKGIISNMRLQQGPDGDMIIRGKGINLNTLPVYDSGKNRFREGSNSQSASNSMVNPSRSTTPHINQMGQYRIVRRVMQQNRCIGYEVEDYSGSTKRFPRRKVIELAIQKLIDNAVASKSYVPGANGQPSISVSLRGVGCDLNRLPILIADASGKIVDPKKTKNMFSVRGAVMQRSGVVKNNYTNKVLQFRAGDVLVCEPTGELRVYTKADIEGRYVADRNSMKAVCDDYLGTVSSYSLEIFGGSPIQLNPGIVLKWTILKPVQSMQS